MTDEEIAVKLTALEHESKSAKHRLDDLEVQNQAIQDLAISVKELTINMSNMFDEQRKQGEDIEKMKAEPGERWNTMTRTIFTSIISTVGGGLAVGLILMIAQYIK